MPPPVPPSVNDGRMIAGSPTSSSACKRLDQRLILVALRAAPAPAWSSRARSRRAPVSSAHRRDRALRCARAASLYLLAILALELRRIGELRARRLQPDLGHRVAEQRAVLGLVDRVGGRADHLDVEFLQRPHAAQRERAVERGLPAHGRQQREAAGNDVALLLDDLGDDLRRDRLDVGRVGQIRVGHDRRRIGIDQHDPVALGLQRLAGLRARIVELAGLTDHDRARADDQNRRDISAFRHPAQ